MPTKKKKQAIDATRLNAFAIEPDRVRIVGIDTKDGPEHPLWDERVPKLKQQIARKDPALLKLGRSLRIIGQLHNVVVRKDGDQLDIVVGRRRCAALRLANEEAVARGEEPAKLKISSERASDKEVFSMMVAENIERVNHSPLANVRLLQRGLRFGHTEAEMADLFNVTMQTVKQWGLVLDLHDKVQAGIDEGVIPITAAVGLADLPREEQVEKLAELVAESGGKAVTQRAVRVSRGAQLGPARKTLRKVLKRAIQKESLSPGALHMLKWILGEVEPDSVKGLVELLGDDLDDDDDGSIVPTGEALPSIGDVDLAAP